MLSIAALIALSFFSPQEVSETSHGPGPGEPGLVQTWSQYHGALGNRTCSELLGRRSWLPDAPPVVWKTATPRGFSSFVVDDRRAYTLVAGSNSDGIQAGSARGEVCVALDLDTGRELWRTALGSGAYDSGGDRGEPGNDGGDGPRTTPSVDAAGVFVLDSFLELSALNRDSGKLMWKHDIVAEFDGRLIDWQNAASPLIEGDLILVAGGGAGQSLLAFDKHTGSLVWKRGDERMTHATPIAVTMHSQRMVIFYLQSGLVAVDPSDGRELWRQPFDYRVSSAASPVVAGDIVYVSAGYGVGAAAFRLRPSDEGFACELLWRKRNRLMNHWSTPVVHGGHLFGLFSFKKYGEGPLQCVDLASGEVKWSREGFGPGNCILVGEDLVVLSDAGEVVLVAATEEVYRELARSDVLVGKCWSSPAFSAGQLYVRSTLEGARLDLSDAGK